MYYFNVSEALNYSLIHRSNKWKPITSIASLNEFSSGYRLQKFQRMSLKCNQSSKKYTVRFLHNYAIISVHSI